MTGELLVAEKYDPAVNWTTGVEMDKSTAELRASDRRRQYSTFLNGQDVNTEGDLPRSARHQGPAAGGILAAIRSLFYVPTNHVCMDYEPFSSQVRCRSGLCRRDAVDVPARRLPIRRAMTAWATSLPGTPARARSSRPCLRSSRSGRAF